MKRLKEDIKLYSVSALLIGGTMAMVLMAAVKSMDEVWVPDEEYTEACIAPTISYVESEKWVHFEEDPAEKVVVEEVTTSAEIPLEVPKIPVPQARYALTDEERYEIERVVMAECGAEPYEGIIAVAQCILNACEKSGKRPPQVIREYKYTPNRKKPSETVKKAVSEVFDDGREIVEEYILYFYAPSWGNGAWHETQEFVIEIGGHRFFAEALNK